MKIAMIRLHERLAAVGLRARLLLQVHDELLLEVPRDEVDGSPPLVRETMEAALPLDVPLTVDLKVGDDWESMTPLTRADAIAAEADEAPGARGAHRAHRRVGFAPCPNFPRSRRSRATCARARRRDDRRRALFVAADAADPRRPRSSPRRSPAGGSRRSGGAPSWSSSELSRDAALTIQLKMTGQLFVVPADAPEDPYVHLVLELDGRPRAAVPGHPQVRPRRPLRTGPVTGELVTEVGGRRFRDFGPEPLDPAFTRRAFRRATPPAQGPAQAAAPRPDLPRGRRQHLRRRGALALALHPLRSARRCAAGRAPPVRGDPRRPGRGGRASRDLDRRLHGARGRRRDAGAPRRLPAHRRAVPALRPTDQADRARAAVTHFCSWCQRLPAADRAAAKAILRTPDRRRRPARPALDRAGGGGEPRADADRGGAGRDAERTERTKRAAATRRAAARDSMGAGRWPSCGSTGVTREIGTFVILDAIDAPIALGDRIGLVGPNGAGKTTLLRLAAGRDEPDPARSHRKRGLTIGLLAQEAHLDAAFMAAPDAPTGGPHRRRPPRGDGEELAGARARRSRRRAGLRGPAAPVRGARRLHARPARRRGAVRARVHAATSGRSRRRRCRAASRRAPRSPGSSSRTPTCCCSTSPRTTSTSTRSSGSRSTSGVGPARSWSPRTTAPSSTRR